MLLKYKLIISLFFISHFFYAQEHSQKIYGEGISVGHIDTLYSEILTEEREILIYLPESVKYEDHKREKYPVIYLLDGRSNFLQVVSLLKQYAEKNGTKILPEMIIVGISNKNHQKRQFDYSPTQAGNPENYGGGDRFLRFIKEELFLHIESDYPAAKESRTFIGHSFGGVAILNALSRHPEMFKNYLAIDSSIWFDGELFLNDPEFNLTGKDLSEKNIFVGIANTATYGSTLESIKTDTIGANRFVRHSLDLVAQIGDSPTRPNLNWKYYERETHGSVVFPAQLDALRFFFSWFEFKEERKYQGKYNVPDMKEETFANLTERHFEKVSEELGYNFYPTAPWLLSNYEMLLNYHQLPQQAQELLQLSEKYYPENKEIALRLNNFGSKED